MTNEELANAMLVDGLDNLARYLLLQRAAMRQLARELLTRQSPDGNATLVIDVAHDLAELANDSQRIADETRKVVATVTTDKFNALADELGE